VTLYDLLAIVAAGGGVIALVKGRTGLGVAGLAAGAGSWMYGRYLAAASANAAQSLTAQQQQYAAVSAAMAPAPSNTLNPTGSPPAMYPEIPYQVLPGTAAPQTQLALDQYKQWLAHIATLPAGAPLPPPPPPNATSYTPPPPPPAASAYKTVARGGQAVSYVPQSRTGGSHF